MLMASFCGIDFHALHHLRFLQGPDTDKATVSQISECIRNGTETTVRVLNYTRDGRPFWNLLTIASIYDMQGKLRFFVGVQVLRPHVPVEHAVLTTCVDHALTIDRAGGCDCPRPATRHIKRKGLRAHGYCCHEDHGLGGRPMGCRPQQRCQAQATPCTQ